MVDLNGQGHSRRKEYLELLKDPRWQRKRLEIFQRDAWTCQRCGEMTVMLSVHHLCYHPGKDPWESPDEELLTLCEPCHTTETRNLKEARGEILHALRRLPWETQDLHMLCGFLSTVQYFHKRHGYSREEIITQGSRLLERCSQRDDERRASQIAHDKQQRAIWQAAL
jgi:hypothetical protein